MSTSTYRAPIFTNGYEHTQGSGYALPEYPFEVPPELQGQPSPLHPVVVVGGGITGLTMACSLAVHGVPVVLVDEDNTVGVKGASSRGICYTQKSLEILDRLGVFQPIAHKGIEWHVGRTFAGDDEVFSFDLKQQQGFSQSQQPSFINIQQFYIEGYLVERLMALKDAGAAVDLRWCSRVVACKPQSDRVSLDIDTPQGRYSLDAQWVVDASGSHTPFHQWLGVEMKGERGDDRWCIADVRFKHTPPTERHTWIQAPFNENRAVWQHLMGDEVWRIDYQMAPDADPAEVSKESVVRERLARQFGPGVDCDIIWVGPYAYRSVYLDQLQVGRVFFMGDTAKIVSPFGARGGNTGIADADNLAWKLAAVVQGRAPASLLASYHQERHQAAEQNIRVTRRTAHFLRPQDGMERVFRSATIALAKRHAFARPLINTGRMAEANRYTRSGICEPSGGVSMPNVSLRWVNGQSGHWHELMGWAQGRLLLLVFGAISASEAQRLQALGTSADVRVVQVVATASAAQAREAIVDAQGQLQAAAQATGMRWALTRPDAYVAATGKQVDGQLVKAVAKAMALMP
jgi:3-(3-hydroxy-phenyl)propionate hydroxylase